MMARTMRRFKQYLPHSEVERILQQGKYCVIAVSGDDDYPYAVPVNYVYDGKVIYLHSASAGTQDRCAKAQSPMFAVYS